jgi:hypothetical protein
MVTGGLVTVCLLAHVLMCIRRPTFSSHCLPHNAQGTVDLVTEMVAIVGSIVGAALLFFGAPVAFVVVYRFDILSLKVRRDFCTTLFLYFVVRAFATLYLTSPVLASIVVTLDVSWWSESDSSFCSFLTAIESMC